MRVGVIGGSGFLGMNILRHLAQNSLFQLSASYRFKSPTSNSLAKWSQLDLASNENLDAFLNGLDAVIYLAHTGGPHDVKNWEEDRSQNLQPIENLFSALRKQTRTKPIKMIYFSSGGALYGKSSSHTPWKESDHPQAVSSYGKLKKMAEDLFEKAAQEGLCECICLRVSNPYGNHFEHSKKQGIIDVAISKIKSDEPFTLYGSKDFVRDFIHMDDLMIAVELCLKHSTRFEVFNIGSGIGSSIGSILESVQNTFGKSLKIEVVPMSAGVVPVEWSVLDISKAKKILNWSPKIALSEGLHSLAK